MRRSLNVKPLETLQLLAADFRESQNAEVPEDVSADGIVSTADALMLVNRLSRLDANLASRPEGGVADINGDRPLLSEANERADHSTWALTIIDSRVDGTARAWTPSLSIN